MLSIFFGDKEEAFYDPSWFKYNYDPSWFRDTFVQKMMVAVDHSAYKDGDIIESDVLGSILGERASDSLTQNGVVYYSSIPLV